MKIKKNLGFSLIELMMVLVIAAILFAIAVPSYRQYMIKKSEKEVQIQLLKVKKKADKWKSKALSYKNFSVSDITTKDYKIEVRDFDFRTKKLNDASVLGNKWVAIATPKTGFTGDRYLMFSNGESCMATNAQTLTIDSNCTNKKSWE